MKLLVCGGRNYINYEHLCAVLDYLHHRFQITLLIEGGASGADALAGAWAISRRVPVKVHQADWARYGTAAGPIRNRQMLEERPDMVLAFPGGAGTRDMCRAARRAGVTVRQAPPPRTRLQDAVVAVPVQRRGL